MLSERSLNQGRTVRQIGRVNQQQRSSRFVFFHHTRDARSHISAYSNKKECTICRVLLKIWSRWRIFCSRWHWAMKLYTRPLSINELGVVQLLQHSFASFMVQIKILNNKLIHLFWLSVSFSFSPFCFSLLYLFAVVICLLPGLSSVQKFRRNVISPVNSCNGVIKGSWGKCLLDKWK